MRRAVFRRGSRPGIGRAESGQSLVEFSLILTPLFFILLGIIQFGFIFNTYVTVTNAAREAGRTGSIYVYDRTCTKAQNDLFRNESIRIALRDSLNLVSKSPPQFSTTAPTGSGCIWSGGWTSTGTTFSNGDVVVTYVLPSGVPEMDARTGQQLTVRGTYHQDLVIPLISNFLPKDAGGRLSLTGEVTMVIN